MVKEAKVAKKKKIKPEDMAVETDTAKSTEPVVVAKAGKRSAKAVAEVEEKKTKVARKASKSAETKAKPVQKAPRSRLERASKKYREVAKLVEKDKSYSLADAIGLATKTTVTKFDATVELHVKLGVDPKQADQNIRDTVLLPAGSGKTVKITVLAEADDAAKAIKAGADSAGKENIFADLDKEKMDFDVLIATPALMPALGKYARLLGPRGLMPNPKSGTVTTDVAKAVSEAKAGRVEYRIDPTGIVHLGIGKVSQGPDKLFENAEAVMSSIRSAKPASLKGVYIRSIYVATTMGPSIHISI